MDRLWTNMYKDTITLDKVLLLYLFFFNLDVDFISLFFRAEFFPPEGDSMYPPAPPPPPPLALSSRPVVVAQIPPPPSRVQQRFNNGIALNKVKLLYF